MGDDLTDMGISATAAAAMGREQVVLALVCHEPGRHDPSGKTHPTPAVRLCEEEERPQSLRVP